MGDEELINQFTEVKECEFKGRHYLVRDNGAILRVPKLGVPSTKWDNVWTFGVKDSRTGYMLLASTIRVHQVVCTAFHGPAPEPNLVVDHKDTNRSNNRPENLSWVTRLENVLNNPITRHRIELACGSIEAFLKDPSILRESASEPNSKWMRTVSPEEAAKCLKNLTRWAEEDKAQEAHQEEYKGKGLGEWVYGDNKESHDKVFGETWDANWHERDYKSNYQRQIEAIAEKERQEEEKQYGLKDSLTPGAKQLNWKTPTAFPLIPKNITDTPLQDYLSNLSEGAIYCTNQYSDSPVYDAALSEDGSHLSVITEISGATSYALSEVYYQDGAFVHKSIRSFFTEDGAVKYFTLSLGRKWTGGDVLEDSC